MALKVTYPFDNSSNYNFDSSKIEVSNSKVKLKVVSVARDWSKDFSTSSDYTYDSDKIEFTGGVAQLKLNDNPSQEFRQDCDSDSGFTYESDKILFDSNFIKQRNQRKANCTCGATWSSSVNLSFGDGPLDPIYNSGAVITNNRLDLTIGGGSIIRFNADGNADMQQVGALRIKITPNYSGFPSTAQYICSIARSPSDNRNLIRVHHDPNGNLYFLIKSSTGATIFQAGLGEWSPTSGQTYKFLITWDLNNGVSKVYIDDSQFGSTQTQTGTRDSNINTLEFSGNYYAEDLEIFTANPGLGDYTVPEADYVETVVIFPDFTYNGPGSIVSLDDFYAADFDEIHYTIEGKYWDGSSWVASDDSYSQSNTYSEIDSHIDSLSVAGQTSITIKAIFPNSNDQGMINYITISYTGQKYFTDHPSIEINEQLIGTVVIGGWNSFNAIVNVPGNDRVTFVLSDDNGSTWKYWNGSSWVTSPGYSQSNIYSDINDNISSFPISEGLKIKIYLHSDDGTTTPSIDSLTVNYNDGVYSTDNPILYPNSSIRTDKILSLSETSIKPTNTEIKYIVHANGSDYYWDGNDWITSDGSYAQSNTVIEVNDNLDGFPAIPSDVYIKILLHTSDNSVTPELDQLTITYDYAGSDRDTIAVCTVTGWITDIVNNLSNIDSVPIIVNLCKPTVKYKNNVVLLNETKTFYSNSSGYFELKLIENENMESGSYYVVSINKQLFRIKVPNQVGCNFLDIII